MNIKKIIYHFILFNIILISSSYAQIINEKLIIELNGIEIQIKKTKMSEMKAYFELDSVIEINNEKIYVIKDGELILSYWDKNKDGIIDGIDIYSSIIKTWHGIHVDMIYSEFLKKCKVKELVIDPDNADKIVCHIDTKVNEPSIGFYFSGDYQIYDSVIPEEELYEMIKENSFLYLISIWNPN